MQLEVRGILQFSLTYFRHAVVFIDVAVLFCLFGCGYKLRICFVVVFSFFCSVVFRLSVTTDLTTIKAQPNSTDHTTGWTAQHVVSQYSFFLSRNII